MFVPIYDENPLKGIRFQYATIALIAINCLVFLVFQLPSLMKADFCSGMMFARAFGIVPLELTGTHVPAPECADGAIAAVFPEPLTLLTYMFLHGDFWHLLGNMLFLWVFGDNVEDALGHVRFVIFYLLAGIAGGLLHALMQPYSPAPLIGASGAVAGVIAAYLLLHPRVTVWVLVMRFFPLRIPAAFALGAWVLMNLYFAFVPDQPMVAWWAHIGGLVAGALLILVMRRPGVPLFDRTA
ncbi:MAG: rhomboid family intramembrane serine protease [Hyphomicrobiaceae bacterium]